MTYLIPVSVKGIIFEDGRVWLRKNERDEWELPGGKIDHGEQPEETVIRELREELGVEVKAERIISADVYTVKDSIDEDQGVLVISYLCSLVKRVGRFEIEGEAGKAIFRKFSTEEVQQLNMPNFYKTAIKSAFTQK